MSPRAQLRITLFYGVCIAERATRLSQVFLYQLEGFYVEVHHHKESAEVLFLSFFESTDRLTPYLLQLDLEVLLQS